MGPRFREYGEHSTHKFLTIFIKYNIHMCGHRHKSECLCPNPLRLPSKCVLCGSYIAYPMCSFRVPNHFESKYNVKIIYCILCMWSTRKIQCQSIFANAYSREMEKISDNAYHMYDPVNGGNFVKLNIFPFCSIFTYAATSRLLDKCS